MKALPIDLSLKTVTTKVATNAWERVQELKRQRPGVRLSDLVSVCLLYMPEAELDRILAEQAGKLASLPKPIQALLKNLDTLTAADREMLRDLFSD